MWGNTNRQVVLVNGFYRKRLYVCFCVIFRENLNLKDKPNVKCFFFQKWYMRKYMIPLKVVLKEMLVVNQVNLSTI